MALDGAVLRWSRLLLGGARGGCLAPHVCAAVNAHLYPIAGKGPHLTASEDSDLVAPREALSTQLLLCSAPSAWRLFFMRPRGHRRHQGSGALASTVATIQE